MYNYSKIIGSKKNGRFRRQSDTKNAIPSNLLSHLQHTRNFRELFLYEFINSIDEEIPDGARGQGGYQRIPMTLGQKKRLRNQIFRDATAIANKRNANTTNAEEAYSADDPSILVEAFFNSEFGSRYASLKSEWLARGSKRRDVINRISGWSGFDNMQYYGAIAISPYDPLFEDSELFSEMGEAYDGVVYCKTIYANDENHNIPDEHQIRSDMNCVDARLMEVVNIPVVDQDGKKKTKQAISVKGGYTLPGKHILEASHENTAYIVNHGEMKSIDSALSASGYTAIARYIKSRKSKEDVKAYFEDAYKTYGATDSKQIDFMKQLCNYLVEKGRPFSVEMARDGYPVARLETGVEIRLFNANPAESLVKTDS